VAPPQLRSAAHGGVELLLMHSFPGTAAWLEVKARYEEALGAYEQGRFRPAARMLADLLAQHPDDAPSLLLLSRAVNAMVDEPPTFSPVWDLPGK